MLIPSAYRRLPQENACHSGKIVMGGTVSQMASALAQLSHCKFLGEAHYQVSHTTYSPSWGAVQYGARLNGGSRIQTNYKSYKYNFLYKSTAQSEHLALLLVYGADYDAGASYITAQLRDTASNSYNGTLLDAGIVWRSPTELQSLYFDLLAPIPSDAWAFSGTRQIAAPTNTVVEQPRPLYVPSANRGDLLNIQITVNSVSLVAVHIYDLYHLEVAP